MQNIYIHDAVNGFGLVQGMLLSLVIFFYPGGNRNSNKYLAAHVFFISLALAAPFSQKLLHSISPRADRFTEPFLLLIYPALYLYIRSFAERIRPATTGLHLIPFFLFAPLVIGSLVYRRNLMEWSTAAFGFDLLLLVFVGIKIILFGAYLYACWQEIHTIQALVKANFSETSRINLNWAKQLVLAGAGLLAVYTVVMAFIIANPALAPLNFLLVALLTGYIYFASFKGLAQPAIFQHPAELALGPAPVFSPEKAAANADFPERAKYQRSALPETRLEELMLRLKDLMVNDRLFLEPELTIQTLGEKLDVSPYYISQVLNQKVRNNFYDFVNAYRVEEAKRLLQSPAHDHFTLLAIAFDAGFNSKTTFNTVFKKFTGQTPSQYRSGS